MRSRNVGICHSDFELYEGRYIIPVSYPIIPGHEWSGEIAEVGSAVHGAAARATASSASASSTTATTTSASRSAAPTPSTSSPRRPGCTAFPTSCRSPGRVRRAVLGRLQRRRGGRRDRRERRGRGDRRRADRPALRDGGGDDGRPVTLIEPQAHRRALGLEIGARGPIDPTAAPLAEQAAEATDGRGFDVVIEAAGAPAAMASAFPIAGARRAGRVRRHRRRRLRAGRDRARPVEGAAGARDHRLRRAVAAHDPVHGDERPRPGAAADGDVPARRRHGRARRRPRHSRNVKVQIEC